MASSEFALRRITNPHEQNINLFLHNRFCVLTKVFPQLHEWFCDLTKAFPQLHERFCKLQKYFCSCTRGSANCKSISAAAREVLQIAKAFPQLHEWFCKLQKYFRSCTNGLVTTQK
jgi:Fe-S-cluster formation regulator IscX/YfhJ